MRRPAGSRGGAGARARGVSAVRDWRGGGAREVCPPYTLHPTPCTLHPTPYTLHPTGRAEFLRFATFGGGAGGRARFFAPPSLSYGRKLALEQDLSQRTADLSPSRGGARGRAGFHPPLSLLCVSSSPDTASLWVGNSVGNSDVVGNSIMLQACGLGSSHSSAVCRSKQWN